MRLSVRPLFGLSLALLVATADAATFTPDALLQAPRRSPGVPNRTGKLILHTVSTYSFETHNKSSEIRVLNVADGQEHVVSKDPAASEPVWISETEVAFLQTRDDGGSSLLSKDVLKESSKPQTIHKFHGVLSSPKTKRLSNGKVVYGCAATTTPEGELLDPAAESEEQSTAMIYTSLFVRHWDTWRTENYNSIWYGQLHKRNGRWGLQDSGFNNLLAGTNLSSPIEPFGGAEDFDISEHGIVFTAKDPELNAARFTKTDLYYVKIDSFVKKPAGTPQIIKTKGLEGYSTVPTFSSDGKQLVFLRMKSKRYEADKARIMLVSDVSDLSQVEEFYKTPGGEGGWNLTASWVIWGKDDKTLYVSAEENARSVLWKLPSNPKNAKKLPIPIFKQGSISAATLLNNGPSIFVTSQSMVDSSTYSVLNPDTKKIKQISSVSQNGKRFGLSHDQVSEIWYEGSAGYDNHALVMKPSNFDSSKKYPLAFLIHGGPQSSWSDSWSTRWNPAVFAEQGYVVVMPNPTGSVGYGQAHIDAITDNWGGNPYKDLVKCFEHLEGIDYIDTERAVALGASYGGYMINWIQGHDFAHKFKCLVCHDGVFSTLDQWSTEELWFAEHDFNGTLWGNRDGYSKWDPAQHTDKWDTPMLVIHNEKDFRIPISQGLSMFNVLQARNVSSKLLVFPDENHWVLKPENSRVWHREVLGWINKYSNVSSKA